MNKYVSAPRALPPGELLVLKYIFPLFLFFLLIFCPGASAQVNKNLRDSLALLLAQHPAEDTERIRLLNRFARVSRHDNPDTAMLLTGEAFRIADKIKATTWIGRLQATKSMVFAKMNQYDSAIKYGLIAADLLKDEQQFPEYLTILNIVAEFYSGKGDFSKAIDIFHQVARVADQIQNKNNYGSALGNIGSIYYNFNLYDRAIEYYEKALAIFNEIKDSVLIGAAETNIGLSYYWLKQNAKAQEHLQRSLEIFESLRRTDVLPDVKTSMALAYAQQGNAAKALSLLNDALQAAEQQNNTNGLANIHTGLAIAKKTMGDSLHQPELYKQALQHAEKGLAFSTQIKDAVMESRALGEMAALYFRLHQFQKAYIYQERFTSLRDSIAGENRKQEIAIKESEFENANARAQLVAKHQAALLKQKNARNLAILISIFVLLTGALIFIFYRRYNKNRALQLKSALKAEMAELEMKALRAQMNPHFIFNSLNSIGNYLLQNDTRAADDYLARFAQLMRLVLENSEQKEVPLSRDLKALELYMQLEAFRLGNKFSYAIHVDESVDPDDLYVPPSLLQPLVENSIWHGIMPKKGNGHIGIFVKNENGMTSYVVEDDGVGIKNINVQSSEKKHDSLGMKITRSRIEMLNHVKHSNASIHWYPLENGTRVQVLLPQV